MITYFKAFKFDGKRNAHKALNKIEDSPKSYIWVEEGDIASISVNQKGHIRVHCTWAQDSIFESGGTGFGVLAGGLIGLLLGPGGAIAGAAAGGLGGGLIGKDENKKFDDPVLSAFAKSLVPDSSALVLLGPEDAIEEFTDELIGYEAETFVTELDQATLDTLKKALKK